MMQIKSWTVAFQLCTLITASSLAIAQDKPSSSSMATQGSIIGFAVVLSFLVISIFSVMLICSCYGLCKCPCKRSIAREAHAPSSGSGSSRRRRERPMIPLPSPRMGAVKQSTSSTFQYGQKLPTSSLADQPIYSKLQFGRNQPPPAPSTMAATAESFREDERRLYQLSPTRFSVPPPTSAPNVMHLGQIQSHSYHSDLEQLAQGSTSSPPIGRQGGRAYQPQSQQQRHEVSSSSNSSNNHHPGASSRQMPNAPSWNTTKRNSSPGPPTHNHHHQNAVPPHFQARPVDVPPPYPGVGYPYTPCKSPKTPHSTTSATSTTTQPSSLSHSQLHNRRTAMRQQQQEQADASRAEVEGQGAGGMEGESEALTDIDSITESNSVVSGRGRFKELATSPPSYSTEV